MGAYYNEYDPGAAAWLRELIKRGLIADGEVDERSILDVSPDDLRGHTQCHFFAGIGGWSHALRLAGVSDDTPLWTGSPPCQPFSSAGRQLGSNDERHLAPHFADLVSAVRPPVVFGEQVASSAVFGKAAKQSGKGPQAATGWAWIDDLSDRLEAAHYSIGAVDFPSAGISAPHVRQRTYFGAVDYQRLAYPRIARAGRDARSIPASEEAEGRRGPDCAGPCGPTGGVVNGIGTGLERHGRHGNDCHQSGRIAANQAGPVGTAGASGGISDPEMHGSGGAENGPRQDQFVTVSRRAGEPVLLVRGFTSPLTGFWADSDWLHCRDGKWRPAKSSVQRLADGVSPELVCSGAYVPASQPICPRAKDDRRVMRLKGYGNAINPHAAAAFISAFLDALDPLETPQAA